MAGVLDDIGRDRGGNEVNLRQHLLVVLLRLLAILHVPVLDNPADLRDFGVHSAQTLSKGNDAPTGGARGTRRRP